MRVETEKIQAEFEKFGNVVIAVNGECFPGEVVKVFNRATGNSCRVVVVEQATREEWLKRMKFKDHKPAPGVFRFYLAVAE